MIHLIFALILALQTQLPRHGVFPGEQPVEVSVEPGNKENP